MNKIRIRIRKFSGLRIRFEIRIRSKKRFVSTLKTPTVELSHQSPCLNTPHDVQATEADGIDVAGLVVAPALGRYDHLDTPLSSDVWL